MCMYGTDFVHVQRSTETLTPAAAVCDMTPTASTCNKAATMNADERNVEAQPRLL